jgi:hypothetical protein
VEAQLAKQLEEMQRTRTLQSDGEAWLQQTLKLSPVILALLSMYCQSSKHLGLLGADITQPSCNLIVIN